MDDEQDIQSRNTMALQPLTPEMQHLNTKTNTELKLCHGIQPQSTCHSDDDQCRNINCSPTAYQDCLKSCTRTTAPLCTAGLNPCMTESFLPKHYKQYTDNITTALTNNTIK